jgi:hypothetical protein
MGPVTNAKNIKADTPKILRPFKAPKILRPKNWLSALFPEFFFPILVVGANIWSIGFEGNKAKNHKAN